jgi:Fe-Mn family superoxide dismutase
MISRRSVCSLAGIGLVAAATPFVSQSIAWAGAESGPHRWQSKGFTPEGLGRWPSDVDQHLALYEGYVKKANEILTQLTTVSRDPKEQSITYSALRALKVEYSFAVGGVKNHEIFFGNQLSAPKESNTPAGRAKRLIVEHFGSVARWEEDLRATGISARGWAWLAYDRDTKTLFNYIGDGQNSYPIWNAVPLLALDMYEHAFFKDYGRDRGAYITDFMKRVNWEAVEQRLALL